MVAITRIALSLVITLIFVNAELSGEIPSKSITYRIINLYPYNALTLDTSDPDPDNKPYIVNPYVSSSKQHFQFEPVHGSSRSDEFYMKNVGSNGRYVQINYASLDEGARLHEWQHATQANAAFKFLHLGQEKMQIMVGHSGMCLHVRSPFYAAAVEQAICNSQLSEQHWRIESVSTTCKVYDGTAYRITSRQSGDSQSLEILGASMKDDQPYDVLALNNYTGHDHQKFTFEKSGFAYSMKAKHSGMVLQVANFAYQDNVAVVQAPDQNAPAQKWRLEPALNEDGLESGYCFLIADHSGKALDTQFHLPPNAGRVAVQSEKNAEALSQHWKLDIA